LEYTASVADCAEFGRREFVEVNQKLVSGSLGVDFEAVEVLVKTREASQNSGACTLNIS
jgi:hypothetical protein